MNMLSKDTPVTAQLHDFTGGNQPPNGNNGNNGGNGNNNGGGNGNNGGNGMFSFGVPPTNMSGSGNDIDAEQLLINYNDKFQMADPILFRDSVVKQTLGVLIGKNKPNPLLVGPAGVGKTKIVEDIARRLANNDPLIPDMLRDYTIYELTISTLVSNTSYRGQLESRIEAIINFITEPNTKRILFIDEIHTIIRDKNLKEVAQYLKPALARSDMHCIGSTTTQEVKELNNDPAFNRRFSKVIVDELSKEQTVDILKQVLPSFLKHYYLKIAIDQKILPSLVDIADDYHASGFHRPDTALTLLDRACGDAIVERNAQIINARKQLAASGNAGNQMLQQSITTLTQGIINISEAKIKETAVRITTGNSQPSDIDFDELKIRMNRIKGQDEARDRVLHKMRKYNLGLFPKVRPLTMLFSGPSGVGKTEMVKILAQYLTGTKPIILNMTEYHDSVSINRIIGAPAGYVGYDDNNELPFDSLMANPYQVILLDEFEKCHKRVQTLFMQAFDEGYIQDSKGNIIDFSKAIIIATTNAGYSNFDTNCKTPSIGFATAKTNNECVSDSENEKRLRDHFDFALLNRFSDKIPFNSISKEIYRDILVNMYDAEYNRIINGRRRVNLPASIPDADLDRMVETTYNKNYGARPARNTIEEYILDHA